MHHMNRGPIGRIIAHVFDDRAHLLLAGGTPTHTGVTLGQMRRCRSELQQHPRVRHNVTLEQARVFVQLAGEQPVTYRLDPDANWLPDGLVVEDHDGLAMTYTDEHGRLHETVVLGTGSRFELYDAAEVDWITQHTFTSS